MSTVDMFLDCPSCGCEALRATHRIAIDKHGNDRIHRIDCRCRWCDWSWCDGWPVTCPECGQQSKVDVDEEAGICVLKPC